MRHHVLAAAFSSVLLLSVAGCVERKMYIRSDPPGAPVWLDGTYVGVTPIEHPFVYYGLRRVRVGPLRDKNGVLTHREQEVDWEVDAPGYEKFPIDFFFEVLYPRTLVDEHELPLVALPPVRSLSPEAADAQGQAQAQDLVKRAEAYREQARSGIPEEKPTLPAEGE
jgi:hypothetical protein